MSDLEVRPGLVIPEDELYESASRSGGPGGQHVNKANTRVTLRWSVSESTCLDEAQRSRLRRSLGARLTRSGELVVHAQQHRSRARNRELARARLAQLVREALATRARRVATRPTRASRQRRLEGKRRRGSLKRSRRELE